MRSSELLAVAVSQAHKTNQRVQCYKCQRWVGHVERMLGRVPVARDGLLTVGQGQKASFY